MPVSLTRVTHGTPGWPGWIPLIYLVLQCVIRDPGMGRRIVRVMEKMQGISSVVLEVGTLSQSQVMEKALDLIRSSVPLGILGPCSKPMTVALFGTHCAGKRTLGKLVAQKLNFIFQPELGEVLRTEECLVGQENQHREGYSESWDDLVFREECKRDAATKESRVVETWHIGEE